ncbi:HAD family hydrolase [Derxia gummosa]|uniref:phosphoglycolate phosphatase n=1 Tax=Derxia gummosa DSM 723 TaxID=1121388 RepID=A0A8B6X396_9BURK|nr:HAD-IA family hydrolase [Derxia gummosa]
MGFTHLISDCDGVLIDSEALSYVMTADELASRFPSADRARDILPLLQPRLGMLFVPMMVELSTLLGAPMTLTEIEALHHRVDEAIDRLDTPMPGVGAALAATGLPLAVASNSEARRVRGVLARTGLAPLFHDRVYSGRDLDRPKPAPDVYLAAAAGFGVAPARCLVVEDSTTGVTAARAAGMTVLGFTGGGHLAPGHGERLRALGAVATFGHMEELPALVSGLVGMAGKAA